MRADFQPDIHTEIRQGIDGGCEQHRLTDAGPSGRRASRPDVAAGHVLKKGTVSARGLSATSLASSSSEAGCIMDGGTDDPPHEARKDAFGSSSAAIFSNDVRTPARREDLVR